MVWVEPVLHLELTEESAEDRPAVQRVIRSWKNFTGGLFGNDGDSRIGCRHSGYGSGRLDFPFYL